jgi:hypothetical protein
MRRLNLVILAIGTFFIRTSEVRASIADDLKAPSETCHRWYDHDDDKGYVEACLKTVSSNELQPSIAIGCIGLATGSGLKDTCLSGLENIHLPESEVTACVLIQEKKNVACNKEMEKIKSEWDLPACYLAKHAALIFSQCIYDRNIGHK